MSALLLHLFGERNPSLEEVATRQNYINPMYSDVPKVQEEIETYECRICKKTFYNTVALHNHSKFYHDGETLYSEAEQIADTNNDEMFADICDFKFLKISKADESGQSVEKDGITRRIFDADTSYLLVKVEGEGDTLSAKRSRLDGVLRRTQSRQQKPSVDLRGPFTCTLPSLLRPDSSCHQIFFNCCEYSLHYHEKHTKRRKAALRCQVCEKRLDRGFSSLPSLASQLTLGSSITFPCRLCGQVFLDSAQYDEHNRYMHPKLKPHQCSVCAKRFTQQGGLQQHMRMHTGIRPFICSFCSKTFTQKAGLDQHLRTHTKIKPFKCVICSKCFSQSVHLRQHMRTHTNIQPFECPVCGRRFKQSSHLNFHMRSHDPHDACGLLSAPVPEPYASLDPQINFMNFANVQPVHDGDTVYYSAELAPTSLSTNFTDSVALPLCDRQVMLFGDGSGN
ncbi:zinc finger protein 90-like [Leptidea sinapis]|uniref:zinc finger protein 90-like n=1 Tax=Leptidea sinapis TaxID=189913 RepID=UPI0021C3831D|nr:zinc finger protein 90-like [Leptidea sinapis]